MSWFSQLRDQLLSRGSVYSSLQVLIGSHRLREEFVSNVAQVRRGARVLDMGCGPGTLFPYLKPLGVDYVGFDHNPEYVDVANGRFADDRTRFVLGDAGNSPADQLAPHGPFDVVIAAAVLHHLSDAEASAMIACASELMAPDGVFASYDNALTKPQNPIARRLILADRGKHVRPPEGYKKLASTEFTNCTTSLRTDLLAVPYTIFFMRCTKV